MANCCILLLCCIGRAFYSPGRLRTVPSSIFCFPTLSSEPRIRADYYAFFASAAGAWYAASGQTRLPVTPPDPNALELARTLTGWGGRWPMNLNSPPRGGLGFG